MTDFWITTATGHELDLREPQPSAITLDSIAHSLAQINRFTGHARRPYSVAEHSLLVAEIAERSLPIDCHGLLAALLHDAHEAYCGDLHSPGKRMVGDGWFAFEYRLQRAVRGAFSVHGPSHVWHDAIKQADLMALATERAQLLPSKPGMTAWSVLTDVRPVDWVDLMEHGRCTLNWRDWRQAFTDRYDELDFARNQRLFDITRT